MNPYDIELAFAEIEEAIITKLINQFRKDRPSGKIGNYKWKEWRLRQLKSIKGFIDGLKKDYADQYDELNNAISEQIALAFDENIIRSMERQAEQIEANGFYEINRTRMETLQEATINDLAEAESAVFRKTEDEYRQIIYKSQVALNSGTVTYDQAVDMATRDFLNKGLETVAYYSKEKDENGKRKIVAYHHVKDYAKMVLRTTMQRAGLMADGEIRKATGVHTVYGVWRSMACPLCIPWLGRVMVDDVYGGGTKEDLEAIPKEYDAVMLSYAMSEGFLHPNCKDTIRTYDIDFWKDDPENDPLIKTQARREQALKQAKELEKIEGKAEAEKLRAEKWERREKGALSSINKQEAKARKKEAQREEEVYERQRSARLPQEYEELALTENNLDGSRMQRGVMKEINDALAEAKQRLDFRYDRIIIDPRLRGKRDVLVTALEMHGYKKTHTLYINPYLAGKNLNEIEAMIMDYYEKGWWESKTLKDLIAHETIHARVDYLNSFEKIEAFYERLAEEKTIGDFNGLVAQDKGEFLNEAYVRILREGELEPKYQRVYNKYFKEYVKG